MMSENLKIFFQPSYLFNPYPTPDTKFMVPLLVFFGILTVLSIVALFLTKKKKKKKQPSWMLFAYIYNWLFWIGIIGLIALFFRYEGTGILSMRAILLAWILTFVIWGICVAVYYFKGYKKTIKEFKIEQSKKKYFTGRRK